MAKHRPHLSVFVLFYRRLAYNFALLDFTGVGLRRLLLALLGLRNILL
jgi:hypothetical protein